MLSAQPAAGIPPEWETRKLLDSLVANAKRLSPLVDQINPGSWKDQAASEAYTPQWRSVRNAVNNLQLSAAQLAGEPTRITFALDTLFRLDGLNQLTGSLASGVRRYHNPAMADLLLGVADENSANHISLKQYVVDLASTKEGELKVMEAEAQRCLGIIVKEAPPVRSKPPSPAKPSVPKDPK